MTDRCPCGAELTKPAELAHHICNYCRVDAKKKSAPRRRYTPDFVDVPIPGFENWGAT
jgi:hypothetical protein